MKADKDSILRGVKAINKTTNLDNALSAVRWGYNNLSGRFVQRLLQVIWC